MANKKILNQISLMMYGFGDSDQPDPATVELVESIVKSQLRSIVNEALKYNSGPVLKGESLVFLLRHNKYKMQRFVRYLKTRQITAKCGAVNSPVVEVVEGPKNNKLLDFVRFLDETGEFLDISEVDETKLNRMLRADQISKSISKEKYMEYQQARIASFKKIQSANSFKSWVDPQNEIEFDKDAMDVLSYLAFQTVAEIVDYAFFVRADVKSVIDPFETIAGTSCTTSIFKPHGAAGPGSAPSKVFPYQVPIRVHEVQEVMRRVHNPQAGKLNFGGPMPETHFLLAL
ncbi:transcription initiation protein SPT3 homolog [Dendroctonus ponderosae]